MNRGTRRRDAPARRLAGNMYLDDLYDKFINVDEISLKFLQTPEFQRLQNIKHLGVVYMVHPDAKHSAYEHSLGAYWLAHKSITRLREAQGLELGIENFDVQTVKLAGLLHDVGRGPFGQIFEDFICPSKWSREEMSMRVIDYMVDRNHIDVDDEVIKKAKDLAFDKSKPIAEKKFLYDIVANSRDSTDACTIDSVMRDMRFCGLHRSFDFSRGFDIRVIDDKICYFYDHYTRIHDFFLARADLHRLVYTHSDIKVIELMVADALVKAKATLNFTFENPADYLKWDDTVLDTIENSTDQSLKESQDLIRRVRDKDFYKLCSEVVVPEDKLNLFKEVTPEDVFSCVQKTSGGVPLPLGEENIRVSNVAFGKKNPFESIYFHNKKLFKSQITLIPDDYASFQGKIVRVFAVSNQSEHTKAISEGFGTFVYNKYGLRPMNLEGNLTASFGDCYPCLKRLLVLMSVLSENREPAAEKYVAQLLEETKKCPELATFRGRSFQKVESIEDLKCVKFLKTKGWYHVEMECYVESWHPMLNEMQLYAKTNKITLKLIKIAEWTELDHVKINNVEKDEMAGRTCRLLEYHTD